MYITARGVYPAGLGSNLGKEYLYALAFCNFSSALKCSTQPLWGL